MNRSNDSRALRELAGYAKMVEPIFPCAFATLREIFFILGNRHAFVD
jgi:hypothetical protein